MEKRCLGEMRTALNCPGHRRECSERLGAANEEGNLAIDVVVASLYNPSAMDRPYKWP